VSASRRPCTRAAPALVEAPVVASSGRSGMVSDRSVPPSEERAVTDRGATSARQYFKSGALLVVAAASLYLLLPKLVSVYSSWKSLEHADWRFAFLVVAFEGVSSLCLWQVDRIALGTSALFPIACAQLAGNALGRIVPASATPATVVMLRDAGMDGGEAAAAFTTSTWLQVSTALALPVLAIPAMLGGVPVNHGLATAAYVGAGAIFVLVLAGVILFKTDAPLDRLGRAAEWLTNATVRRDHPVQGLSHELLSDRDFIDPRWIGTGGLPCSRRPETRSSTTSRCWPHFVRLEPPRDRPWSCSRTQQPNCSH
jgi:hypothetical protein